MDLDAIETKCEKCGQVRPLSQKFRCWSCNRSLCHSHAYGSYTVCLECNVIEAANEFLQKACIFHKTEEYENLKDAVCELISDMGRWYED